MYKVTINLRSRKARSVRSAGGKAATLSRLYHRGFDVPPGFVIVPGLFNKILDSLDWNPAAARDAAVSGCCTSTRLRQAMKEAVIPEKEAMKIKSAFRSLAGPCAVRSSLIGEDSRDTSFAGQLDSVLRVETESDLMAAIKICYASILNERFESYIRQRFGLPLEDWISGASMAVLVQRMVAAKVGGVMFSADPLCGRRSIVIEAVQSGAEAAAGGKADPERYVIAPDGTITEAEARQGGAPLLDKKRIEELVQLARDLHGETGAPQDIEWAWDGESIFILQCRPITSLSGKRIYSNRLVSDMTPGLMKPLLWSTNVLDMTRNVFGRLFSGLLGKKDIQCESLVALIHSRVYVDVTFCASLLDRLGLPCNFFEMMTRDERAIGFRPKLDPRRVFTWIRMALYILRHVNYRRPTASFIERHEKRLAELRRSDWNDRDENDLLGAIEKSRAYHGETQWFMWIAAMNMVMRNKSLASLVRKNAPAIDPNDLLLGLRGLKSLEPNERIREMATMASEMNQAIKDALSASSDEEIRRLLRMTERGKQLIERFDDFMERYGFLSVNGTDFTISPWKENPTLIWSAVGRLIYRPGDSSGFDKAARVRQEAERRVREDLPLYKRLIFDRLYRSTIDYVKLRERITLFMSENAYQMRRIYLALGAAFRSREIIERREDIFYLEAQEIGSIFTESLPHDLLRKRVEERKSKMLEDGLIDLDDTICCESPESCLPPPDKAVRGSGEAEDSKYLSGIKGSSGTARGRAHIVKDPSDVERELSKKDILVVPFTDVGWTPLFPRIGGIVAETGGQLSHSSIIAREYGLPAVVNVRNATRIIQEGQMIAVDGNSGRVYLE